MDPFLRTLLLLLKVLNFIVSPINNVINRLQYRPIKIPPIMNELLKLPAVDLATKIRQREVSSVSAVQAYVQRIKLVNPLLNAMVEDRFEDALKEAAKADQMTAKMTAAHLLKEYPLLGVPFTVKESCSLKGLSYSVGSSLRRGITATKNGVCVENLRAAGAIPLLVSNTPEFCTSWESNNYITGRTVNPHDSRRTSGGSSGGEGALIGAGASLFGVGSDVAGSIRLPAMFNGIFGHKPTGGVLSIDGHFPMSSDSQFRNLLVVGPMCRYARDLPTLVHLMAGDNAHKLRLDQPLLTKDIKVFYMEDAGFSLLDVPVQPEIKIQMRRAVEHFRRNGVPTQKAPIDSFQESLEAGLLTFFQLEDIPLILRDPNDSQSVDNLYVELAKCAVGQSKYTFAGLFFLVVLEAKGLMTKDKFVQNTQLVETLRTKLMSFLGDDGVLFYPTFPVSAFGHNDSYGKLVGVMYTMIFNVLGFPSTNVPLGKDLSGQPIGMQVIAAPYQDRLCLCMAGEIEAAFGGWVTPY